MKRREFIAAVGGAAVWPLTANAQQVDRVRRIGALMNLTADDQENQRRLGALVESLKPLGWTVGHNLHIDYRWAAGDPNLFRKYAEELVALSPDLLLASVGPVVHALQQVTSSIPIVFATATDPVGAGLVESLARPGGNTTGFTHFEFNLAGKLVEILKEIAPNVKRAAVLRDPRFAAGIGQLGALQGAAQSLGVELTPINLLESREIERQVGAFARTSDAGLIVPASTMASIQRKLVISLAAHHRLPAVFPFQYFVVDGGLISYGPDFIDQYRKTATYVDRILKGEKPASLPVQQSTKYILAINLTTAKALGLTIPPTLLARADEVIE